jgi:hypothetical protein
VKLGWIGYADLIRVVPKKKGLVCRFVLIKITQFAPSYTTTEEKCAVDFSPLSG